MDSSEELDLLLECVKKVLNNSRSYKLNILIRIKKACDKNNLTTYSEKLELKIERAERKREKNQECLEELKREGLEKGSTIKCKNCLCGRKTCKTTVFEIKPEGYIQVNCKKADLIGDELPLVEAIKIEFLPEFSVN